MQVIEEGIGVELAKIRIDTTDGQVHRSHLPGGGIAFLAINRDVVDIAGMAFYELRRLDEHAARSAARVVHASMERLDNLNQGLNDARGSIEFAGILSLGFCEFAQAVLIRAAQDIARIAFLCHLNVSEQVDNFTQSAFVELLTGKILRQDVLQLVVFRFNLAHGLINNLADFGGVSRLGDFFPTRCLRHEEDIQEGVFVTIFLEAVSLFDQLLITLFELIGNVFQKDKAKDNILVLGCVDVSTQFVGSLPNLFFKADFGSVVGFLPRHGLSISSLFYMTRPIALKQVVQSTFSF